MPVLDCPSPGCGYTTGDVGDSGGAVLLKFHIDSTHGQAANQERNSKLQLDRPRISTGASSEDWTHFTRDWATYKDMCRITEDESKKVLFECCDESLKHLMYGQYTTDQQTAATEAELLESIKRLAVVHENTLTHRLRLSEAVQAPGQNIHSYLAVLKSLACPCNFVVRCTRDGCTQDVNYSENVIKDQLVKGMSDDTDRQRLLAEPNSETMSLDAVVIFLHSLETSHRPIHGATNAATTTTSSGNPYWRCGKERHPDNSSKRRERHDKCKHKWRKRKRTH